MSWQGGKTSKLQAMPGVFVTGIKTVLPVSFRKRYRQTNQGKYLLGWARFAPIQRANPLDWRQLRRGAGGVLVFPTMFVQAWE